MKLLKLNPAAILFAVNAVVNVLVAWGVNLSPHVTGAISAVVTAVLTIIAAALTRPVGLQAIAGGTTALLTVLAPFAFPHLSSDGISQTVILVSLVLAGILHLAHVPVSAWKQGTTAAKLEAATVRRAGSAL